MDLSKLKEPLQISQIDFRVQSVTKNGKAIILAYKDARVDMDRLDEVLGPDNWQRKHELIDGQLFCHIGIWGGDNKGWVWKQDVGTESNTEKEKGRASDAFKRACFNLGIGRELYDFPFIMVQLLPNEFEQDQRNVNKMKATYDLRLKEWRWYMERDENGISFLAAKDQNEKVRWTYGKMKNGNSSKAA